jgi:hypothetical protein
MSRAAITERAVGLPAANWWAHQSLGHGGQGAWLERAGELIDRFPALGAAVRRGDLSLDHLRVLDEVHDGAVLAELTEMDGELCRVAERASTTNWRREVRRRVERIRVELADRHDAARDEADRGDADRGDADEVTSGSSGPTADGGDPIQEAPQGPTAGGDSLFDGLDDGSGSTDSTAGAGHRDSLPGDGLPGDGWCAGAGDPAEEDGWLTMRTTAGGGLLVRGELKGVSAEVARQLIAGELSQQRRSAWSEHDTLGVPIPGEPQLRARALVQLLRDAAAGGGSRGASRTEAVAVIEADDRTAERVRSLDGEPLGAELAAVLCCDAALQALIVDRAGQPLWLGRSTRLASAAQRRALAVRDGGCAFPGCEIPPEWCDAHHQPTWSQGGRSDPEDLVLLCRRHHGLAHSRHWQLRPAEPARPDDFDRPPPRRGQEVLADQRFEWVDRHTGAVTAARQRGLRSPPAGSAAPDVRRCA